MAERGLLTRLASGKGSLAPAGNPVASILQHLRVLLNTRKGEAIASPSFGILDFNDIIHTYPAAISKMQQSIRAAIQEFEPRLKNVTVTHLLDAEDPTALRFEISAQLNGPGLHGMVRFVTRLRPGSEVELW